MTWPLSRKRTYIDGITQVPAADMNDIQDFSVLTETILGFPAAAPSTTSDIAQVVGKDAAGHVRGVLMDHNGLFTMGHANHFREEWRFVPNLVSSGAMANSIWQGVLSASCQISASLQNVYPAPMLSIFTDTTTSHKCFAATNGMQMPGGCAFASYVLEFDAAMSAIGANGNTYWAGLCGTTDPSVSTANGFAWFRKGSGNTNWQAEVGNGASTTTFDTGVIPTLSSSRLQRFRIEYHGSTSPYGACVRFFIDGVQVGSNVTTNMPTQPQGFMFGDQVTGGVSGNLFVGTLSFSHNRSLSPTAF